MALGSITKNERYCLDNGTKSQLERLQDIEKPNGDCKPNGLRVRFLDEEGKTERMVSADECDYAVSRVKKIHILKNRSSSETSIMLRNPSLMKRRSSAERRLSDGLTDNLNNNSLNENLNERITMFKVSEFDQLDKTDNGLDKAKELNTHSFKRNCNVYSVNQAKTLTPEKKKSNPLVIPKMMGSKSHESKSILPAEVCLADAAHGKDFTARTFGRLSRGLGRLLRRTNSVRISEPDPTYKVAYLGNVLTGWAKGESCVEKPLATLWRNYQQTSKPDVVMKLSVTNSGLKGFTKEHGLTEYWSHRITYCASPPHYPKLFCWVYRHEGKKLKHELRCHAVLCTKESISKKITEELQVKLKQALVEFKKDRISKQNARLSLANSVYDNPSMPRRKIMLSVGAMNYRPPLERSKSAPKLGAIEELCSEEDEEEADMKTKESMCDTWINSLSNNSTIEKVYGPMMLDRRRPEMKSPRKLSCPEGMMNITRQFCNNITNNLTDEVIDILVKESEKAAVEHNCSDKEASFKIGSRLAGLESISESNEIKENGDRKDLKLSSQSNFLVTDSDDGSVSSGCETASTATSSDVEPSSLPSQFPQEEILKEHSDSDETLFGSMESIERNRLRNSTKSYSNSADFLNSPGDDTYSTEASDEVNHVPIGERNAFRRRSTYPPLGEVNLFSNLEDNFESLIDNLTDVDSLNLSAETDAYKAAGDTDSACSDESGYSESLETAKDGVVGNTIMV